MPVWAVVISYSVIGYSVIGSMALWHAATGRRPTSTGHGPSAFELRPRSRITDHPCLLLFA